MNQTIQLFCDFDIEITNIRQIQTEDTINFSYTISNTHNNNTKYFDTIGYRYNTNKNVKFFTIVEYLR